MTTLKASVWFASSAAGALMCALPALAADLPVKAMPLPQSIYNWTGFYVGGHVGYGKGMKDWLNSSFDYQVKGFLGGGQVGYNQQVGNVVFGIEADASWGNIKGDQTLIIGGPIVGTDADWCRKHDDRRIGDADGTARPRAGPLAGLRQGWRSLGA